MLEPKLRSLADFHNDEIEREEMVLEPWLPDRGLAMLAGSRGLGKTMLGVGIAIAIAGGGSLLGWRAPEPRGVLYVDGEMALTEMQDRAVNLLAGATCDKDAANANLWFYCDADQENGIKNLIQFSESRRAIEKAMEEKGLTVLILDNLSALCNSDAENDVESWTKMQDWLRRLRRAGYTVIFLHHAGKPNEKGYVTQRGTSKREDILNTSILMVDLHGKDKGKGFKLLFTKHRGFLPDSSLEVRLSIEPTCYRLLTSAEEAGLGDLTRFGRELG